MGNELIKNIHFAFNIWDLESAKAVIDGAYEMKQDVILQTSVGIYKSIAPKAFIKFVKEYAKEKKINVWVNLDHCKDIELTKDAIDNGWDMVMFDASSLPLHENIKYTNEIIKYAHDRNCLVEAEVGQVKGIEEDIEVTNEAIASKDEIKQFLDSCDVDMIAVAFGNAHGNYVAPPVLHYDLVEYTTSISNKPFVVHGGSGLSEDVLKRLIRIDGVKKINISTEVKHAYRQGIINAKENGLFEEETFQAQNVCNKIHDYISSLVKSKLELLKQER